MRATLEAYFVKHVLAGPTAHEWQCFVGQINNLLAQLDIYECQYQDHQLDSEDLGKEGFMLPQT